MKTELRWLLEGHDLKGNDSNYVRVTEKRLQQEYEKAINLLTINEENRLRRRVQTLSEKNKDNECIITGKLEEMRRVGTLTRAKKNPNSGRNFTSILKN